MRHSLLLLALLAAACRDSGTPQQSAAPSPPKAPGDTVIPDGPLGTSIKRGLALLEHTPDSLPQYVGGNLRCTSCHLDRGTRPNAAPLTGVQARFPKFMDRSGAVVPLEDRVNYCFTRSLAGRAIPQRSREMVDIVAYLAFISRGAAPGGHVNGEGMAKMVAMAGDSARGSAVFAANCSRCHGGDGAGVAVVPAVWGPKSFSIGASMARVERAATFVRHNMPFDKPGTLTDQQAFDVATFIDSHGRPDSPGKELDYPTGGAPADVPYDTRGHSAPKRVPLLPRKYSDGGLVPAPVSVLK
jgi:thiosulfate dehydrogenase